MNPKIRLLKEAVAHIKEQPDQHGFAAVYQEFMEWASAHGLIGHSWKEFSETLVMPGPTEPSPYICNTDEACCHFNESTVVNGEINLHYYKALPNYFTGLGILGTFAGLVCGIYLAGKGLASDDPTLLKHALQQLLEGASLAFWTSIVGIITSIAFSIYEKRTMQKLHRFIATWNTELDKRIVRLTPESLASRQLEQLGKQTEHLETFVTEVAVNIADALDQRMSGSLVPVLERLAQSVEAMRSERSDSTEALLRDVVESFKTTMTGSAGREMEALSGTLAGLKETLLPLLDGMRSAQAEMQQTAGRMAAQVGESYEKSSRQFAAGVAEATSSLGDTVREAGQLLHGDLTAAFGQAAERMQAAVSAMEGTLDRVRESGQASGDAADKTRGLLGELNGILDRLQHFQQAASSAVDSIRQTAGSLTTSNGALVQAAGRTEASADALRQASEQIRGTQELLERQWGGYAQRFEAVDESLATVFGKLQDGLKGFAEATGQYMSSLDGQAEKVTGRLASAVSELDGAITDLTDALGSARRS